MLGRHDMTPSIAVRSRPAAAVVAPRRDGLPLGTVLDSSGALLSFRRDQEVFAQDGPADHCYRVVSGCVRTVILLEDGRRQVAEFLLPGDLFGFASLDRHDVSAEAVTDTVLRRCRRRDIDALADGNGPLARQLRDLVAQKLRQARGRMVLLGRRTAFERIASFLLEMERRAQAGAARRVAIPMTRTDIADHLGLTIETVCRVFSQLRREGAIEVGRSEIVVRDRRALEAVGGALRH